MRGARAPKVNAATVAAVQTAFQRSRLSHKGWTARRTEGRIDGRHVWRNDARGVTDIFKDRQSPSATKLNVWLLVDASGSMAGYRAENAQDLSATIAEAFKRIPTVTLRIYQHTMKDGPGTVNIIRNYGDGVDKIRQQTANVGGGNADGFALMWIGNEAVRKQRPDERSLIIVLSDGAPTDHGLGATNGDLVGFSRAVSEELRAKGVGVIGVGIANNTAETVNMYGKDNVVMFNPSVPGAWSQLAREFGALFGRLILKGR